MQDLFLQESQGANSKSHYLEWLKLSNSEEPMGLWMQRDMAYI